jgi:hypothetical protein
VSGEALTLNSEYSVQDFGDMAIELVVILNEPFEMAQE